MGERLRQFNQALDRLVAALRIVIIVLAAGIFVVAIGAVIGRYVFGGAVSWSEEVPRYLLIWISFLGAAICVDRKEHIAFDVLFSHLPAALQTPLRWVIDLLILAFGFVMFWWGIVFVQDFGGDLMETIPYKNYWYYVVMPISGLLIMLFVARDLLNRVFAPQLTHDEPDPLSPGKVGVD
jgi:TRAP-type C4-dicarboxylate transport system permease small subunit